MRKAIYSIMLTLLLICTPIILVFNVRPAEAAGGVVTILRDGSIYPSTAPMQRNGNLYTLTGNITVTTQYTDGIRVEKNDVILDGAGFIVRGLGDQEYAVGVYLRGMRNVTIINIEITQFFVGVEAYVQCSNISVYGSNITDCNVGVQFTESSHNNVSGNDITGSGGGGIELGMSSYNNIVGNYIKSGWAGIELGSTSYNSISRNNITETNGYGIEIFDSSYSNIAENQITGNYGDGIWLSSSKYNIVSGNTILNNWRGIVLISASNNCISGNNISASSWSGIDTWGGSTQNNIVGNTITNCGNGIWLMDSSNLNSISGNVITSNGCGIRSESSSNNFINHNNIIDNTQQAYTYDSANVWDDGYPSGGNFWSDYTGADNDGDGIGDIPYIIDGTNIDRYPHMNEWESIVFLYPSNIITDVGATFSVDVMASRFQNLWAWQVGLQWDPTSLECMSYTWSEFRAFAGESRRSPPTIDNADGKTSKPALESALGSLGAPVSTPVIKLLTITFKAINTGTSSLKLVGASTRSQDPIHTTTYPRWSDTNHNGVVDNEDIELTYSCWKEDHYNQTMDFNDDANVDITDISIVTSDFGKHNTDSEWGATNVIYDVSTAATGAEAQVRPSEIYISVPYHAQAKSYYCGPASLEMVFDYYGSDISQLEIADVARTSSEGTWTPDMIRAAHFSNMSTSMGRESHLNYTGYTRRDLGYVAFEYSGLTRDELKSILLVGYPVIVMTPWHFRVAVGYNSTHITFQDSYYGSMLKMTWSEFESQWEGNYGLLVTPWKVKISNTRNVMLGSVFDVTATITYQWVSPFPNNLYPALLPSATITLPEGLTLVSGETPKKPIGDGGLSAGNSANVTWTVQAESLGHYMISVEAEGVVNGIAWPHFPDYPEPVNYEDRVGGSAQNILAVTSTLDKSSPSTIDNYDGLWHNQNFRVNLTAEDDISGVMETYYRINNGLVKVVNLDGQPYITTSSANNALEYWSEDWAGNEEFPHKFLTDIKLDATSPLINVPVYTPSENIQPDQEVKVTVSVTDVVSGVKNVTLLYTVTSGSLWKSLIMSYNASTSLYEAVIPGQPDGTSVAFKIVAYDNVENRAVKDNSGKYYAYEVQLTYELMIETTSGGITDPTPGAYFFPPGTELDAIALPYTGYVLDHWELNNVNVGSDTFCTVLVDKNQKLKAIFSPILPLSVSVSPLSASLYVGDSLTFTSTVTGGISPYSYQWYLDGDPVPSATSASWIFTPATSGLYHIYLKAQDRFNKIQSETAQITVATSPVGGYSLQMEGQPMPNPLMLYLTIVTALAVAFILFKRRISLRIRFNKEVT